MLAGLAAFITWGFFPLYLSWIDASVSPLEILAHRILWTAVMLGAAAIALGRTPWLRRAWASPRRLATLALSALLVGTNWGTFIWAVAHHRVIETSLGYFINPLLNVALGFVFLGERLRRPQWLAVALAVAGVAFVLVMHGRLPWTALLVAGSFGTYGLVRKQLDVDALTGLLTETLLLSPLAIAALVWLSAHGALSFGLDAPRTDMLLFGAAIFTVVPFTAFAVAAQRLRLASVGLLQYITPTLHFLTGILILGEPLDSAQFITFVLIWIGLAIYTHDLWRHRPAPA
ncbi:EamA family transporter RarD [Salinisphaera sp. Q1T1-3]|nr:EamA family transporter RarD [Salinisphaera sp. Q1T1-3]